MSHCPDTSSEYGISFVSLPGMTALEIIDPIERHRYRLDTPFDLSFEACHPDRFLFPVDRAVSLETNRFELPSAIGIFVRADDGSLVLEAGHHADEQLPHGSYVMELCSPFTIYLEFESSVHITSDTYSMTIDFGDITEVAVGARSEHERPEGTITTTEDPEDMMAAVSSFGSSLKTTSPERSFPTLRGHPPRVELGANLDIPAELSPPDTGITIELPPTYEAIYSTASLAFYLGATLVPGEELLLRTETGFEHELGTDGRDTSNIEDILKQVFLMDCITRTEGLYPIEMAERVALERRVDLDLEARYHEPIATRIERYLEIPFSVIADLVPRWGVAAHMLAEPSGVELLPYLVDDLGIVRVHDHAAIDRPGTERAIVNAFANSHGSFTRSAGASVSPDDTGFVQPPSTSSMEDVWIGAGTPIGASKAIREAYEHRLDRQPSTSGIDITVVCNDDDMNKEEGLLHRIYGSRDDLDFDVTIHRNLSCEELSDLLAEETDFLHYIGHIDDEGFECRDGKLDIAGASSIGVAAFLLNACESYRQGCHLIEGGSIGGIVTLDEVVNSGAVQIGQTLARLLNSGFPLYAALGIAKRESLMGTRYIVVGDGRVTLSQPMSVPHLSEVVTAGDSLTYEYVSFPTSRIDMGSLTLPHVGMNERHSLVSQRITHLEPTKAELLEYFSIEDHPVRIDDTLLWSSELESF